MKTVRDIMSPVVYCVRDTAFLIEAAAELRKHTISGAPVVDEDGEYVGVISQSDISAKFAGAIADVSTFQSMLEDDIAPDMESVMVKDVMTTHLLKISIDADLKEVGQALLIAGVHRLLVVDQGTVVGLVTTTDLIHGFIEPEFSSVEQLSKPVRKPYLFETELSFSDNVVQITSSFGNEMQLEPPPEFGGTGKHSSPEDLFVASISSCLCLTFADFAKRRKMEIVEYKCRAIGRLEGDGVSQRFTRVDLYPRVKVKGSRDLAGQLLEQAKLRCLVGRSSDVAVVLHAKVEAHEAPSEV